MTPPRTPSGPPLGEVRTVSADRTSWLVRASGSGDGTPVLLLHGVPETSSMWSDVLPRLARGRRVLAPDLPGLGGSTYTGPYDVASLVAQLAALVEQESPGIPVDLVGHDWGGILALGLAGARPDLVRRLVVANAPFRSLPVHRAVHVPFFALPGAPELLFRLGGRRVVEALLSLGWRAATPLDAERRAEYAAAYTMPSVVRAMLGYYRAAARPRAAALLRLGEVPVTPRVHADKMLVLWGAADPVLPIGTGEQVVRDLGPDAVMVTVPGAGHFVVEEAPEVVGQVLEDFLADAATPEPEVHAAPPEKPEPAEAKEVAAGKAAAKAPAKRAPAGRAPAGRGPAKKAPPSPGPA